MGLSIGEDIMRIMIVMALAALSLFVGARTSQAYEGAWCAEVSLGRGFVSRDCRFRTFEECLPNVIAGNRGFCVQNPYWLGWYKPAPKPKKHQN